MRAIFWRSCSRVTGVAFPVSALALFFTPHAAEWELALCATAVTTGGAWIYARGRPRRIMARAMRRR
ncbi:hypothetical protein GJV26_16595 [Massilia dura]|uniref:Uncharacterized protein n=1 Tax=Pseudoduganella dura TaxID=321982 RepID=A0A6I3XLH0_9BURK|nr:hypothetical protein [Pseudoduganella dura]MUI14062.1 hypothetical protein [Pseudoduganella dura]GGX92236.1 hypothetical protein GCM10007386_24080 [Pseudoduganella dura]